MHEGEGRKDYGRETGNQNHSQREKKKEKEEEEDEYLVAHLQSTPLPVNGFSDEWVIGDLIRREKKKRSELEMHSPGDVVVINGRKEARSLG